MLYYVADSISKLSAGTGNLSATTSTIRFYTNQAAPTDTGTSEKALKDAPKHTPKGVPNSAPEQENPPKGAAQDVLKVYRRVICVLTLPKLKLKKENPSY